MLCCVLQNHTQTQIQTEKPPTVIFPGGEFLFFPFFAFFISFYLGTTLSNINSHKKSHCIVAINLKNFFSIIFVIVCLKSLLLFCSSGWKNLHGLLFSIAHRKWKNNKGDMKMLQRENARVLENEVGETRQTKWWMENYVTML